MLQVGQKLWLVPTNRGGNAREVTVQAIGRKWAQMEHGLRVNMSTLAVDGGQYTSPGQCYLSETDYNDLRALHAAWTTLRDQMGYTPNLGVTINDIFTARKFLGLDA